MKTMRKNAILGFGREGQSVFKFVKNRKEFRGVEIWILDKQVSIKTPKSIRTRLGKNYLSRLGDFDLIFRSPGIPYTLPPLVRARGRSVRFSSLIDLFFKHAPAKIIGITGTKGKGTTATLLYKMLKAARRDVYLAGNVGTAALDILPKLKKTSVVVLEFSSFQLQGLKTSPPVAIVLDVFPDHQDAHKNLKEYYESKANITRFQTPRDKVFFFKQNQLSTWMARHGRGKKIAVDEKNFRLFEPADLKMPGLHNFKNAVMAATVARALGVPENIIKETAQRFAGNEHRLEFVRKIGGVAFYNDSASTNPQTSAAAVKAFPGSSRVLIAGGKDKGLDYAPLAEAIRESRVKTVVIFGENKKKILRAVKPVCKDFGIPIESASTLRSATRLAYRAARRIARRTKGFPIVIFSPGAASFDMFESYADRGKQFKRTVRKLK